eukprot:Tbor_TRINITY_DN5100_c2_g9::TRINITY_DN5100_c2_g9_i1::g.26115::m.26115/K15633/gpmI; 2,3-bisphosphoglycerate-independent phosphoglycerate mutase
MASALPKHRIFPKRTVLLVVMDGVGIGAADEYNALHMANAPTIKKLINGSIYTTVRAHGKAVGLPSDKDMGNSEVGHNALGAGRVVLQGASLVDDAIRDKSIFSSDAYKKATKSFENNTLHLVGLLSNGGVHSRDDQIHAIIRQAAADGAKKIRCHVLYDGRDVPDGTSVKFTNELESLFEELKTKHGTDGSIASGGGRMHVTMDRYEADWSIVERGWKAHVLGEARQFPSALEAISTYKKEDPKINDQYYPPFVIAKNGKPIGTIEDGDSVICVNFRGDRAIEISRAFEENNFNKFDRKRFPKITFSGMMMYDGDLNIPRSYLVPPPKIFLTSGEYLAKTGVRVFACSETQKYGHVTYFWNGNRSMKFNSELEEYVEIKSDNCVFNEKPEMKAKEITDITIKALKSGKYDFLRINYANGDMVGHTGDLNASIIAVEAVDKGLERLLRVVDDIGGVYIVTADHGNCDDMVQRKKGKPIRDSHGKTVPLTSHTLAPVPVAIGGSGLVPGTYIRKDIGRTGLTNITATFINLLGYESPENYDASLVSVKPLSKL